MSSENALQKQKQDSQEGLANAPLKKKIGFFSAMMVVVGSSVGAGIFFKAGSVMSNSQNSIVFAMFCWIFAAFAVVAMGLALIEIASARNDNLSMIGWCQTFNGRLIYKACKNFMFYVYLPLTFFFMPLYVILSIQDGVAAIYIQTGRVYNGLGTNADWAIMMAIVIGMSVYFIVVCGMSSRIGNIQNWIITAFKFIPLVFAAILGFVVVGMQHAVATEGYQAGFNPTPANDPSSTYSFTNMTPGFGMFISAGAIFFAYDGFYVAAGVQSEMKEPKKTPLAILFGLIVVTVIYLIIAISMSLGAVNGGPQGYANFLVSKKVAPIYATFQILIGIGVLGIINGFALWSTRFVEDLVKANELPFSTRMVGKIKEKFATVGIIYNLAISLPVIIVFCIIGGIAYIDHYNGATFCSEQSLQQYMTAEKIQQVFGNGFIDGGNIIYNYGSGVGKLYTFADLMATWTSVAAFTFILCSIVGALRNRKTGLVKVQKSKIFVPMAICAIITMSLPIFFTFFQPIADMFFLFRIPELGAGQANHDELISRIMTVVVLFIFIGLMFIPMFIEDLYMIKKFGSVEAGEKAKAEAIAKAKGISLREEIFEELTVAKRVTLNKWEQKALGQSELTRKEKAQIWEEEYDESMEEAPTVRFMDNNNPAIPTDGREFSVHDSKEVLPSYTEEGEHKHHLHAVFRPKKVLDEDREDWKL